MIRKRVVVMLTVCALAGVARAQEPPPVSLGKVDVKARKGKATPAAQLWVRRGLPGLTGRVDQECYRPALVAKPKLGGKVVVRFKLGGDHVLTGVKVDSFKSAPVRACVLALVKATTHGIPEDPPLDPDIPGAYVEKERQPPPASMLPLTVALTFVLTAPPAPQPTPAPSPSPSPGGKNKCDPSRNPAGCKSKGCPAGLVCDTHQSCTPSGCGCDPASGNWTCTSDCGGGMCVPAAAVKRPPLKTSPTPSATPLPPG